VANWGMAKGTAVSWRWLKNMQIKDVMNYLERNL